VVPKETFIKDKWSGIFLALCLFHWLPGQWFASGSEQYWDRTLNRRGLKTSREDADIDNILFLQINSMLNYNEITGSNGVPLNSTGQASPRNKSET
jgi:hypothetical protein